MTAQSTQFQPGNTWSAMLYRGLVMLAVAGGLIFAMLAWLLTTLLGIVVLLVWFPAARWRKAARARKDSRTFEGEFKVERDT